MILFVQPCVYIVSNYRNGTLYTGVTSELARRTYEHQNGIIAGFTKRHNLKMLVWYEMHDTMETAITREKQIKSWRRAWKLRLIEEMNPDWQDLGEILNQ